jgi:lysophospholipase L1-like esterase
MGTSTAHGSNSVASTSGGSTSSARPDADAAAPDAATPDGAAPDAGSDGGSPGVRVVGRTASGSAAGALRFSWPGVNIHARFDGTQVSMNLDDGSNKNRFSVVVDGAAPKTVTTSPGQTSMTLAAGLSNGAHDLVVWRNTEASIGVTQFSGFSSFGPAGALLAPDPAAGRRIEVIGDSLSVGAGVEGDATCAGGIDAYTNNYLAYGSVAARAMGADVVTIAWSGIGVYRNYDGSTSNTMPARYPFAIPNDGTPWDFSRYQPDVVVINLGTNDFGSGDPGTPYETAYVAFVRAVRAKYANAQFVLIDMYGGNRLTRINDVVGTLKSGGESKVETLSVSSAQNNLGCNGHPNVAGQAAMGAVVASGLKSLLGW